MQHIISCNLRPSCLSRLQTDFHGLEFKTQGDIVREAPPNAKREPRQAFQGVAARSFADVGRGKHTFFVTEVEVCLKSASCCWRRLLWERQRDPSRRMW